MHALWVSAPPTQAQNAGRIRIGIGTELLAHTGIKDQVGSAEADTTVTRIGLFNNAFGANIFGGIGDFTMIGGELGLRWAATSVGDADATTALLWRIVPQVRFVPVRLSVFQLFMGGGILLTGTTTDAGTSVAKQLFGLHITIGTSLFLADNFSVEPRLFFEWGRGSVDDVDDHTQSQWVIGLAVDLAGWIGGSDDEPAPAAQPGPRGVHRRWDCHCSA